MCKENGIEYKEQIFTVNDLKQADEVFISSTTSEVMPIVQINELQINSGTPGKITKKLQNLFKREIEKLSE